MVHLGNTSIKKHNYRPDIDGLRAIAVLSVVIYHADITVFSGGFIGVDIFFVISGYLITNILLKDFNNKSFKFYTFWGRRVQRILPTLTATIIFCITTGWILLLPEDYENLGKQALSNSIFASNILFYLQSGYFDSINESKPLMHTWSLAVEEQFYLFYPICLFLIWHLRNKIKIPYIIFIMLIFSLALSIYAVKHHPSAAFYLLPSRAWEFLLGSLTVFIPPLSLKNKITPNILSISAFAAITLPVIFYTSETYFPGLAALIPCLGTAILIWVNDKKVTVISNILSSAPLVFVGLISYSWYLWHWPLIVFTKYYFYQTTPLSAVLFSVISSFFVSILSWKYIETPLRSNSLQLNRIVFILFSFLTVTLIAYPITHSNIYVNQLKPNVLKYAEGTLDINTRRDKCHHMHASEMKKVGLCKHNTKINSLPTFISFGDSFSTTIDPIINTLSEQYNVTGLQASYSSCPPLIGIYRKAHIQNSTHYDCHAFNNFILNHIKEKNIKHVILYARWSAYFDKYPIYINKNDSSYDVFKDQFFKTMNLFQNHDIQVWIIEQPAESTINVPQSLAKAERYGHSLKNLNIPKNQYVKQQSQIQSIFKTIKNNPKAYPNINFIRTDKALCDAISCKVSYGGKSLYRDRYHLSQAGSDKISHLLKPIFEKMQNE